MTEILNQAMADIKGNRILVAPLNWGLGHATRCVPIIQALIAAGKEVLLAADGVAYDFLEQEFPELPLITLKGIKVKYHAGESQVRTMVLQMPRFSRDIRHEHKALKRIVKEQKIDTVISDNRFGLWCKRCHCIYITHQLMIKMTPSTQWLERTVWWLHRRIINRYNVCWIPDFAGTDNLAGDLTHKYPLPRRCRFIGVLSRFSAGRKIEQGSPYDTVVVISGPEPHRSLLEERAIHHFSKSVKRTLILRGHPHQNIEPLHIEQITIMNHLPTDELEHILRSTPHIICRSGYSSLMDLYTIQKRATLIPTPGQTEQAYLAEYWQEKGFKKINQSEW